MSPVELLLIFCGKVDHYNLRDKVKKSLRIAQGNDIIILVIGLNSKDKIHLEMEMRLLKSEYFVMDSPFIHIGLEQSPDDIVLDSLDGNVLVIVFH
jgi:hypothetical protein